VSCVINSHNIMEIITGRYPNDILNAEDNIPL
jgi:hypothetical protein